MKKFLSGIFIFILFFVPVFSFVYYSDINSNLLTQNEKNELILTKEAELINDINYICDEYDVSIVIADNISIVGNMIVVPSEVQSSLQQNKTFDFTINIQYTDPTFNPANVYAFDETNNLVGISYNGTISQNNNSGTVTATYSYTASGLTPGQTYTTFHFVYEYANNEFLYIGTALITDPNGQPYPITVPTGSTGGGGTTNSASSLDNVWIIFILFIIILVAILVTWIVLRVIFLTTASSSAA